MDSTPLESGGTTITRRAAIIAVIVATGVGFIAPLGEATTRVVSEIGTFTLAFALVGTMAWATRQASGWDKAGWLLMVLPAAAMLVAYGIDSVDPDAPIVSVPLAFHVGPWMTLCHMVAIGILARRIVDRTGATRLVLDAAWLGLGVLLVTWNLVGGPVVDHPTVGRTALISVVAQTLVTAMMIGLLVVVFHSANVRGRRTLLHAAAPAVLLAVSQGVFGHAFINGTLAYGSLADFAFPVAFGVGALACLEPHHRFELLPRVAHPGAGVAWITGLPLVAFGLTAVLTEMSVLPEQYWLGVVVAIVAVIRLAFLALDSARLARTLHDRVSRDPLTGLPNRSALVDTIEEHGDRPAGLLLVELDPFQAVNRTLGHMAADELLVLVGRRLQYAVRADWEVIALEGDAFVVLNTSGGDPEMVAVTGRRIVERLSLPFHLDGREAWIGVRVGAASTGDNLRTAELLEVAEHALRTAKSRARGQVVSADAETRRRARDREELEFGLRHAVDRGELFALFQPKVDLISGAMVGVEALVRWDRPGVGVIPPGEFIDVAEESGLIARVDSWVMADAVSHLHRWNDKQGSGPRLQLSTNMSAWQLARVDVDTEISRTLAWEGGVDPAQLTVELTETLLVEDPEIIARRLGKISDTGVKISVDDFGAGFTAVAYLRKFPISEVKIDRDLVWELTGGPEDDQSFAAAVIALARALNLEIVAEGVETVEQAASLRRLGCRVAQGFLFAKPLPAAEIDDLVTQEFPFASLVQASSEAKAQL